MDRDVRGADHCDTGSRRQFAADSDRLRLTSCGDGYGLSFSAFSDRLSDALCLDGDWP